MTERNITTTTHTPAEPSRSVCDSVLQRIEAGQIQPKPRWIFHSRECFVWFFWLVSVVVGAVAVAVTLYVSMSVPYMLYEATHEDLLTAAISVLPYIWIIIFIGMAYLAIVNLRHTKRGYRYRTVELLGSSALISVALGGVLHYAGGGYVMDRTLGAWIETYPSYQKQRLAMWQAPHEGRMVGTLLPVQQGTDSGSSDDGDRQFVFHDIDEQVWEIEVSELGERDLTLLHDSGAQRVRVIGTSTAPSTFHLCGVFSWLSDERMTRDQLRAERQAFLQSLQAHLSPAQSDPGAGTVGDATETEVAVFEAAAMEDVERAEEAGRPCRSITAVERAEQLLAQ